jgi:hypothetical protein
MHHRTNPKPFARPQHEEQLGGEPREARHGPAPDGERDAPVVGVDHAYGVARGHGHPTVVGAQRGVFDRRRGAAGACVVEGPEVCGVSLAHRGAQSVTPQSA